MPCATRDQLSPNGRLLVYNGGWTTPRTLSLRIMRSDGTGQRQIASYREVVTRMGVPNWRRSTVNDISALAWLGDSGGVVFIALNQSGTRCALFAVNTDGTQLRRWGPRGLCPDQAALSRTGGTSGSRRSCITE